MLGGWSTKVGAVRAATRSSYLVVARQKAFVTSSRTVVPLWNVCSTFVTTSSSRAPAFTPPTPSASSSSSSTVQSSTTTSTPPSTSFSGSSSIANNSNNKNNHNVGRTTNVRNKQLPKVPNTLPYLAAFVAAAIASWGGFTIYATNKEKLSSSIFKSVVGQVKNSIEVQQLLSRPSSSSSSSSNAIGGVVVPILKRETWLGGMCRVKGSVNMMQGRVDLCFKITLPDQLGNKNSKQNVATVYFTSIRAHKHSPFEILRFVVVHDSTGESISLLEKGGLSTIDVDSGDIV
ncbi:uncharacterized protein MEPE_00290 [Melanopsichium pennsylvanicum]|uniref:Uncharacterized protein n=1 Tax=Melanopsichium pennsylvanicum TaxID=63383 RepID=A0AAJ5C2I1_9BASI|nr:uncharacterized protein MEPE_00290 [Melanopsichium pennsylvanicum]